MAATSRKLSELKQAVGSDTDSFLPLAVDIVSEQSTGDAIEQIVTRFGSIDIIVNNAGYGQLGALEELTDAESRTNFDVNVFGSLNVIRKVMPYLRKQNSGHILNISSIARYTGSFPGWGIYCATKFAVVGFTEALAEEVKEFGVKATAVMPGYFRTEFLNSGSLNTPRKPIEDYTAVRHVEDLHANTKPGNQPGDPDKAANAIIEVASRPNPPVHLLLGQDSYDMAIQKMNIVKEEVEVWKDISTSTNFGVVVIRDISTVAAHSLSEQDIGKSSTSQVSNP